MSGIRARGVQWNGARAPVVSQLQWNEFEWNTCTRSSGMSLRGMMVVDLYRMNARQNVYSYAYTRKLNALVHALLKMDLKRRRRRPYSFGHCCDTDTPV